MAEWKSVVAVDAWIKRQAATRDEFEWLESLAGNGLGKADLLYALQQRRELTAHETH